LRSELGREREWRLGAEATMGRQAEKLASLEAELLRERERRNQLEAEVVKNILHTVPVLIFLFTNNF
jgi:hypothetical protein